MTYRDDLEAAQARIRTLEAELEAERERREAAEAATRAAEAARDELKLRGAAPTTKSRRSVVLLVIAVAGGLLLVGLGAVLFLASAGHGDIIADEFPPQRQDREPPRALPVKPEGQVTINSTPPAAVYLDGRRIGTTPLRVKLKPGRYDLKLEAAGYRTLTHRLHVRAGQPMAVFNQLVPVEQ